MIRRLRVIIECSSKIESHCDGDMEVVIYGENVRFFCTKHKKIFFQKGD